MNKIIFITTQQLNQRNLERFHLSLFFNDGWIVEYWNVQNIFFNKNCFVERYKKKFKNLQ